jgi:DNA-3-methyladenine glycosylase II
MLRTRHPLVLQPRPPFRLDLTVWALRRRALNEVDRWDGTTYRRTLVLGDAPVEIAVTQQGAAETAALRIDLPQAGTRVDLQAARTAIERILSLQLDVDPFYESAASDPVLAPLAARFRGVRPPRFPSLFECLVNAIALQQLSLEAGITLLNRLVRAFGARASATSTQSAFPEPAALAAATSASIRELGFSLRKATAIVAIAAAVTEGRLQLEALAEDDDDHVVESLTQVPGVGRWSAEYTLLRGLGRLNVFPGDDVGARKNLARWLALPEPLDYVGVQAAVAGWYPYAGLVYFHLLLEHLASRGVIDG